jgi:hypothetical protein
MYIKSYWTSLIEQWVPFLPLEWILIGIMLWLLFILLLVQNQVTLY